MLPDVGGALFVRGDPDATGAINITDGIFILNFLFLGGERPACPDAADTDDNGTHNITDGIYLLNFLFLGGSPPPPPYNKSVPFKDMCGPDPTADALSEACDFSPCAP